jgi:hypothetical protein
MYILAIIRSIRSVPVARYRREVICGARAMLLTIAAMAAGLFAGAAIYINAVEHPARMSCGTELAVREFGPSYRRATLMQAPLAVVGCVTGLVAAWQDADLVAAFAAVLLGAVVPFTLLVIAPTNQRLLNPELDAGGPDAPALLIRWGRLHAARSALASASFLIFLLRLAHES